MTVYLSRVLSPENSINFQGFQFRQYYTLARFSIPKILCTFTVFRSKNSVHFQGFQIGKYYTLPGFSDPKIVDTSRVFSSDNSIHFQATCPARIIFRKNKVGGRSSLGKQGGLGGWGGKDSFFLHDHPWGWYHPQVEKIMIC